MCGFTLPGNQPKGAYPRYPPRPVLCKWTRPISGSCREPFHPGQRVFPTPSFPIVSRCFLSLLRRFVLDPHKMRFRGLAVAQDRPHSGRCVLESCIATRVRCILYDFKSFQVMFGPNCSWQGSQGSPLLINYLAARFPLRCSKTQSPICSVIWSLKAVSPYFALSFSSPLCFCSCSDRTKVGGLQYMDPVTWSPFQRSYSASVSAEIWRCVSVRGVAMKMKANEIAWQRRTVPSQGAAGPGCRLLKDTRGCL